MKIRINNTWLAAGGREGPADLTVNGQRVPEDVPLARSLVQAVINRGNASTDISFTVRRSHTTLEAAETFVLMHFSAVPGDGDVLFISGPPDAETSVALIGAVVVAIPARHIGATTITTYTIRGGLPTNGGPPGEPEQYADMIRTGRIPIPVSTKVVTVVFTTPLLSIPQIGGSVLKPGPLSPNVRWESAPDDELTISGFTVHLSAPVPGEGYYLSYMAIA